MNTKKQLVLQLIEKMKNKIIQISLNTIPIILMISIIPFFVNDYILAIIYSLIIIISLIIKYEKQDYLFLIFWFVIMTISEYFFISTWVETFTRNSLLWIMPIRLPILRAYSFIVIKRSIIIINNNTTYKIKK